MMDYNGNHHGMQGYGSQASGQSNLISLDPNALNYSQHQRMSQPNFQNHNQGMMDHNIQNDQQYQMMQMQYLAQ
jgi:hypothetical protein